MSIVRQLFGYALLAFITLGYLQSQVAALTGGAQEYARSVDAQPWISLSLVALIGSIVLALIPERGQEP